MWTRCSSLITRNLPITQGIVLGFYGIWVIQMFRLEWLFFPLRFFLLHSKFFINMKRSYWCVKLLDRREGTIIIPNYYFDHKTYFVLQFSSRSQPCLDIVFCAGGEKVKTHLDSRTQTTTNQPTATLPYERRKKHFVLTKPSGVSYVFTL